MTPKTASEPTVRWLSFSTLFVIGTDTFLTAPLLPLLQREFDVSIERSGWLVSAYALGYAVFAFVAGPVSDSRDRRNVLLPGVACFALATAACGLTWGFWTLFTARLFAGIAAAFVSPQIWAAIPVVVPQQAIVKTMGYGSAGLAIAQVVGIPIGAFLSSAGWRLPFFAIAALSVALWLLLYLRFPNVPAARLSTPRHLNVFAPYAQILNSKALLLSLLAYLIMQMGQFTAFSFIGSWLAADFGASQTVIGAAMIAIGLGMAVGSFAGPRLVAKIGQQRSFLVGFGALSALYLLTTFASNLASAVCLFALVMVVGGFLFPVLMTHLQSLATNARGTVSSLANAAMYLGTTIGGGIGGHLLTGFPGFSGLAVFAIIAFALSLGGYAAAGALRATNPRTPA